MVKKSKKKGAAINETAKRRMMQVAGFSEDRIAETLLENNWGQSGQMGQSSSSKDPNATIGKNWGNRGKEELTEVDDPEEEDSSDSENENPFAKGDDSETSDDSSESESDSSEEVEIPDDSESEPAVGGSQDELAKKIMADIAKIVGDALGVDISVDSSETEEPMSEPMDSMPTEEPPMSPEIPSAPMGAEPPMPGPDADLMAGNRGCNQGCPDVANPGNRMGGSAVSAAPASSVPDGGLGYGSRGCGNRGEEKFSEEMLREVFNKVLNKFKKK